MSSINSSFNPLELIREDIKHLKYKGVESMASIAAEVGLPESSLVKLDANENVYGTHSSVLDSIQEASTKMAHIYPDPLQAATRQAILEFAHPGLPLQLSQIIAGAGSDDVLDVAMRLFCPKAVVIATPTFGMYRFLAELIGAKVIDVPRVPPSFDVDVEAVVEAVRASGATMVLIPSPNNPTGNTLSLEAVRRLCTACGAIVLVDEAYGEFAYDVSQPPNHLPQGASYGSCLSLLPAHPNLLVTRTLSKWAGLAGLRVGYLLGHPDIVGAMLAIKQPYNVSVVAEAAAVAALRARPEIMRTVDALSRETALLLAALAGFSAWLRPLPSSANFVLCEVTAEGTARTGITALRAFQHLRRRGILVRYFGAQGGALECYFRVSAGRPQHTRLLLAALRSLELSAAAQQPEGALAAWWRPQVVLFDMDGVIADVGDSYRRAILQTAEAFGASVTQEDVDAAKAAGNANNDWQLTHRLVCSAAPAACPSLEEVTARFEAFYQDGGLWRSEALLLARSTFAALAAARTLGIVTGRPRRPDALRFLETHGLLEFFGERIVCMEDAPLKPSPEPVLLALARAAGGGQQMPRAVMIGDTVDDIRAAIGAGVLPLGVVPPNARNPAQVIESLSGAGAFRVFEGPKELQEYLLSDLFLS